jgi:hypothetical protein
LGGVLKPGPPHVQPSTRLAEATVLCFAGSCTRFTAPCEASKKHRRSFTSKLKATQQRERNVSQVDGSVPDT